jgi:hypothetical protein
MSGPASAAREPESGGVDQAGYTPTAGDAQPYADTDTSIGGAKKPPFTSQIMTPQNLVSDPVWGVNAPAGGINAPLAPEIPTTRGE